MCILNINPIILDIGDWGDYLNHHPMTLSSGVPKNENESSINLEKRVLDTLTMACELSHHKSYMKVE
ncbi:MAG: hypothetical protein RBG13Loki_3247 [Promethearchaeota archaeon CR_4]|nr:MAG: hypothetical protein RBG13Loki_3247 [Candidatus Lokiarchaeota archaeon CR_4]